MADSADTRTPAAAQIDVQTPNCELCARRAGGTRQSANLRPAMHATMPMRHRVLSTDTDSSPTTMPYTTVIAAPIPTQITEAVDADRAHRIRQSSHACGQTAEEHNHRNDFGESLRFIERDRPHRFADTRQNKNNPRHDVPPMASLCASLVLDRRQRTGAVRRSNALL